MKHEQSNNCIVYTLDKPVTSHHCVYAQQLMNEAEYLMKNYGDRGGCYGLDG